MDALTRELQEMIRGKRVLILGFGREGRSSLKRVLQAAQALQATPTVAGSGENGDNQLPEIFIADLYEVKDAADVCRDAAEKYGIQELRFVTGQDYQKNLDQYDLVIKSPGIVLEQEWEEYTTIITSQAELFLRVYSSQVIGITGTKGKSTTTTLLYHVLRENSLPALLMGNIGIPAFDLLEEITPETLVVFEFSCHQLEHNAYSPHRGIYLNLYPEHLDHYGTFEKYQAAKENIYRNQNHEDVLYCGHQVLPETGDCRSHIRVAYPYGEQPVLEGDAIWMEDNVVHYRRNGREESFGVPTSEIRLMGHHNLYDIAIVYAAARDLGVEPEGFLYGLLTYRPLPHRLEYVGTYQDIRFYDDSISTICETTIQALDTLPDTGSVLIGGMDRGIDYDDLISYLAGHTVPHIILMATTGKRLEQEIREKAPTLAASGRVHRVETLEEAVELAFEVTEAGQACVLSPAAASYGIFRNFEERGDRFQELVRTYGTMTK